MDICDLILTVFNLPSMSNKEKKKKKWKKIVKKK